jgi:hypothetical protein
VSPFDSDEERELGSERLEAFRRLDQQLKDLPRIEPSPQFEARFRARLARSEEAPRGLTGWLRRLQPEWAIPATVLAVLALWVTPNPGALPPADWDLVTEPEVFDLVMDADPELLAMLDALESQDESEPL